MGLLGRLFRKVPGWVRLLPPHLRPTEGQISRLETIRREAGASDAEFFAYVASHPVTTRRLQRHLYSEARTLQPHASEHELLATVLLSRWISAQQHGSDVFDLSQVPPDRLEARVSEIARGFQDIDALADAVAAEDERHPATPTPRIWAVASRITEILRERT